MAGDGAADPPFGDGSWQLAVACAVAILAVFCSLFIWSARLSLEEKQVQPPTAVGAAGAAKAKAKARADAQAQGGGVRPRGAAAAAAAPAPPGAGDEDADEEEDGEAHTAAGRESRRSAQKEQKKLEKKAQQDALREQRQQKDTAKNESQWRHDMRLANKDTDRLRAEEEDAREREEEAQELDGWKHLFSVESVGEEGKGKTEPNVSTEDFVQYVKVRKVVHLEDLAAHFHMRTASAIERLKQLEKLERISGIFDDRGKYIHVTPEEMRGVADWLRKQGRVTRGDLVAACNRIVRVNPTAEDKARIEEEARAAMATLEEGEAES